MSAVQQILMDDASLLVGARPKRSIAQKWEKIRCKVDQSRSNNVEGRSILAKRDGRGAKIEADYMTPFLPRADSAGFVDTPMGMGPATTLLSPRWLSELGAVGGSM